MNSLLVSKKNYNFFILSNINRKFIYICINKKKIFLILNGYYYYDLLFNSLYISHKKLKNLKFLKNFLFLWHNFFVKKIKVRHKVCWLKIFRKNYYIMKVNYGLSYNIFFLLNMLYVRKKKKYLTFSNVLFWSLNFSELYRVTLMIRNYRLLNKYTNRGFKFSQQKFLKRVGKISKYTAFKSKIF